MFFEVIPTEVFRNGGGVLTYSSDTKLLPGQIVLIPLGRKTVLGIVYRQVKKVTFPTKPIVHLVIPTPIPEHLLKSIFWLAKYYLTPLPQVADLMLPAGLLSRNALKGFFPDHTKSSTNTSAKSKTAKSSLKTPKSTTKSAQITPQSPSEAFRDPSIPNLAPTKVISQTTTSSLPSASLEASSVNIPLNPAQTTALQQLLASPGNTRLLRGITGSGKTNIYLKLTADTLARGQSTILLVPEIALTSQLVKIFEQTFGSSVTLIHSQQTMAERRQIWLNLLTNSSDTTIVDEIRERNGARSEQYLDISRASTEFSDKVVRDKSKSSKPQIVIGPRSALLAPLHNLGLIIIDEAHEGAYYQENSPRYSALRLASFMASSCKIPCILGTATPNVVDYHLARSKKSLVELNQKAKSTAIDSKITVIDLKNRDNFLKNRYFSTPLLTAIDNNIKAKHQTLIFHNRRGSAPVTLCEECGWQALCPECYLPMTLHADTYTLSCHICGHEEKVPTSCPSCGCAGVIHKGFGTQLLESELKRLFPAAHIARFDGDNKKTDDLASLYDSVKNGEIDLLIGTQTLARGLDLPHLATVGIVQADSGLSLPDFAAEERTFELLTQVIGRVGRGHLDIANVFIQSYQPDHPVIQSAIHADYSTFADYLLKRRREQQMPPFTYLARLSVTYKTERTTLAKIRAAHADLSTNSALTISPPTPAFHERTNRGFTWQIILKSTSREALRSALAPYAANSNFSLVLDPPSLL